MTKKVKRTISVIIAAIMLLSTMSVLAFADDHVHVASVNKDGTVVRTEDVSAYRQPTCTKTGVKEYYVKCRICGKEIPGTREVITLNRLASHHQAGPVSIEKVIEPTCGDYGSYWEVTRCVLCNTILTKKLVAVAPTTTHDPDFPVKENIVKATCAEEGCYWSVVYCKVCGKELSRTYKQIPKLDYHVSEYTLDRFVFIDPENTSKVKVQFVKILDISEVTNLPGLTRNADGYTFTATDETTTTTYTVVPNTAYPYLDTNKDLVSTGLYNGSVVYQFSATDNINGQQARFITTTKGNSFVVKTSYYNPDLQDTRGNIIFVTAVDPQTGRTVAYGPYYEVASYLTKSDSGVALGFFKANHFAANRGLQDEVDRNETRDPGADIDRTSTKVFATTRTCADGEEYCAICGKLLNPAMEHHWDNGMVTIKPTASNAGKKVFKCLVKGCNAEKTVQLPPTGYGVGDVDEDGAVTTADARYILRYAVGLGNFDKVIDAGNFSNADYDGSGEVDAADARLTLREAVGLRNK